MRSEGVLDCQHGERKSNESTTRDRAGPNAAAPPHHRPRRRVEVVTLVFAAQQPTASIDESGEGWRDGGREESTRRRDGEIEVNDD